MRLLNVKTLAFEEFVGEVGDGIPPYAIFSHTWGAEEVTYKDYVELSTLSKKGYDKILGSSRLADAEGFCYLWIDACCIDKSSSAELSEAINSMFKWYRDAGICYAYLSDVDSSEDPAAETSSFAYSRWFTRGWTLQELLGPREVVFLGSDWAEIGTKKSLRAVVSRITGIGAKALDECRWAEYSVAQKMSWAAGRRTTRPEDGAYCLMGLFDINMPLLYGEGRKAFSRLQQEILKQSDDHSILAWSYPEDAHSHTQTSGLLAPSPECFAGASRVELLGHREEHESPCEVVNHLLRISMRMVEKVDAIRMQRLRGTLSVFNVVDIQQGGTSKSREEVQPSPASPPRLQQDDTEIATKNAADVEIREPIATPVISIEAYDAHEPPSLQVFRHSPDVEEQSAEARDINSWSHLTEPRGVEFLDEPIRRDPSPEPSNLIFAESWRWYIYEPVIIAPLRCHIGGHQLGILLSRGSITGPRGLIARLHNPSLISLDSLHKFNLTSPIPRYARISTEPSHGPSLWQDRLRWPEIRMASLLSAGYTTHGDTGLGWKLDGSRGTLVQAREFQREGDMAEFAPLVIFYRNTGDDAPWAFFLSIPAYGRGGLGCEVGVFKAGAAPFMVMDYNMYSANLARARSVKVPLGDGQVLVVRYREGVVSFVNLSVEEGDGDASASPMSHEMAKTAWLKSRLFPLLRNSPRRVSASGMYG